jgi:hypothetical protein
VSVYSILVFSYYHLAVQLGIHVNAMWQAAFNTVCCGLTHIGDVALG